MPALSSVTSVIVEARTPGPSDARVQAAVAGHVDGRGDLRVEGRVPVAVAADQGADPDPGGHAVGGSVPAPPS